MGSKDKAREERLAAALRENLRNRKAQAREMDSTVAPAKAGAPGREGADKEDGASPS